MEAKKISIYPVLRWMISVWGLIICLAAFFISGYFSAPEQSHSAWVFIKELTFAFSVAIIIGISLDQVQKAEFREIYDLKLQEFKENSFQALYGWMIPKELLDEVKTQIFTGGFIRRDYTVEYVLREIDDEIRDNICSLDKEIDLAGRILVEIHISYSITNLTSSSQDTTVSFSIEKEDAENFNSLRQILVKRPHSEPCLYSVEHENVKRIREDSDVGRYNNYYESLPIRLSPGETIGIDIKARAVRGRRHTREVYTCLVPTSHVVVKLYDELKNSKLKASCLALSPHSMQMASIDGVPVWEFYNTLLPSQGIMLWWHEDTPKICECKTS